MLLADRVALLGRTATITHVGTHAELLATVPRYRYLLAADDELDDGCEPQPAWEDDEAAAGSEASEQEPARRPARPAAVSSRPPEAEGR